MSKNNNYDDYSPRNDYTYRRIDDVLYGKLYGDDFGDEPQPSLAPPPLPTGFPYHGDGATSSIPALPDYKPAFHTQMHGRDLLIDWHDDDKDHERAEATAEEAVSKYPNFGARLTEYTFLFNVATNTGLTALDVAQSNTGMFFVNLGCTTAYSLLSVAKIHGRRNDRARRVTESISRSMGAIQAAIPERAETSEQALVIESTDYTVDTTRQALPKTIVLANGDAVPVDNVIDTLKAKSSADGLEVTKSTYPADTDSLTIRFNPATVARRLLRSGRESDEIITSSIGVLVDLQYAQKDYQEQNKAVDTAKRLSHELTPEELQAYVAEADEAKARILGYTLALGAASLSTSRAWLGNTAADAIASFEAPYIERGQSAAVPPIKQKVLKKILSDFDASPAPFDPFAMALIHNRLQNVKDS